jgi:hypothetical protein
MKLALSLLLMGVVLLQIEPVTPAKILVVAFISTKSHKITYMGLVEELAKRGHGKIFKIYINYSANKISILFVKRSPSLRQSSHSKRFRTSQRFSLWTWRRK